MPVSATSVPVSAAGGPTVAWRVTTSPKPCFDRSTRPIVPCGEAMGIPMPLRWNVASASFSPTPNCPTTTSLWRFSSDSFWVRCW